MMDRQDQEGPSPSTLCDDCQETWVDSTEAVVLDAACDWHAIIAVLLGSGLTKHVAELGAAVLRTPCHLREDRKVEVSQGESSLTVVMLGLFIILFFITGSSNGRRYRFCKTSSIHSETLELLMRQ